MTVLTGGSVFGELKLLSPLGRGPKASVWVATRIDRDERVTIKIYDTENLPAHAKQRAFDEVVRAITRCGRMEHANLPGVFGTSVNAEDGAFGIVTEYFDGGPFANMGHVGDPMVLDRVLHLLIQLGTLMSWLHMHDVVHGNVKPSNVWVTPGAYGPTIKLLDLCWSVAGLGASTDRAFISPEQAVREPITALSDQWAIAKLLHQMVVKGASSGSPTQALTAMPLPVLRVMKRAMETSPRARFQSMAAFVQALEHAREEILEDDERPQATREPTVPITYEERTAPHVVVGRGAAPTEPGMAPVQAPEEVTSDFETGDVPTQANPSVRRLPDKRTQDLDLEPTPAMGLGAINPSANAPDSDPLFSPRVRPQDPTDRHQAIPQKTGPRWGVVIAMLLAVIVIGVAAWILISSPAFLESRAPTAAPPIAGAPPTTPPPPVAAPPPAVTTPPPPVAAPPPPVAAPPPPVTAPPPPVAAPPPGVGPQIIALQTACEKGSSSSCIALGEKFEDGSGVPKSTRSALIWFERACSLRSNTCAKAGSLLVQSGNTTRARRLYERACDARSAAACERLGSLWRQGIGGSKNERTADAFTRRACQLGLRRACE